MPNATREDIRAITAYKPQKHADGKLMYKTEQAHKHDCDINNIIKKYNRTGTIEHVRYIEPKFMDASALDFKTTMDKMKKIEQKFEEIPSAIRKRFDNDPGKFYAFMENPDNKNEAIKIGISRTDWKTEPKTEPKTEN